MATKGTIKSGVSLGNWWASLGDAWKALSMIGAVATAVIALVLSFAEYSELPELVHANSDAITLNSDAIEEAADAAHVNAERLDRVLCYLEAEATDENALACSR